LEACYVALAREAGLRRKGRDMLGDLVVSQMSVSLLRRELKILKGFKPQAPWMKKRIAEIEAELRVRASFHY
jgi:hypothetical protein